MRDGLIGAGFSLLGATGLHRLGAPAFRGLGAILMMHRVRPFVPRAFEPNRLLEISPEFLDAVLVRLRRLGYRLLGLDDAMSELRIGGRTDAAPFAVLTFDDGYRDQMDHAVPVLTRHEAPFTLYVTPGFAERRARLWWVELEEAVRNAEHDRRRDRRDVALAAGGFAGGKAGRVHAPLPAAKSLLGGRTAACHRPARAGVGGRPAIGSSMNSAWAGARSRPWLEIHW